jgi:hypothetical protein
VSVVVTNTNGRSGTLAGGFTYTAPSSETILLQDDFNNNSLDNTKWIVNALFSGFTDSNVPVNEANQRVEIGPLFINVNDSHYNGIRSASSYNFTGAYCQVELTQAPAASTSADAMFTIGKDVNSYYRIFVEAGLLIVQKRINGTKATLLSASYNATTDRYWRIRHDSSTGSVIFETAPNNGGSPGAWTQRYSETWNTAAIPLGAIQFEIKAGTWKVESSSAGSIFFDNFKAAKP